MVRWRILSVSYDENLLATRRMLLEQEGYDVVSALGFTQALTQCQRAGFDIFILGHSIPNTDKIRLINAFRKTCAAPILSLDRDDEETVEADFHTAPDQPERFLETVACILRRGVASAIRVDLPGTITKPHNAS